MSSASPLSRYIQATRPAFLTISAVGCLIGFALAYRASGSLSLIAALMTIAIAVIGQASANVINDYYDARNGSDAENESRISPFTGGSRFIQEGLLTETQVFRLAIATFSITIIIGAALLQWLHAWHLIWVGLAGLTIGWIYSADPVRLMARGVWGEFAIVSAWALIVAGSAMLGGEKPHTLLVAIAVAYGLLVANVLFNNQIPDIKADRQAGKMTLAVVTPIHMLWVWYAMFAAAAYALIAITVLSKALPFAALLSFAGAPMSWSAAMRLRKMPLSRDEMAKSIKATILGAHLFGLGLAAGIAIG